MKLANYFQQTTAGIRVSRAQASTFAKEVAGDFNPIHDEEGKRFCVPGDLLFCLMLQRYGLGQGMQVSFTGMVDENTELLLPDSDQGILEVADAQGKVYLHLEHQGKSLMDASIINSFSEQYVQFSGQNFPYILVPMLREQQVMFNVKRPFVVYDSMSFELSTLELNNPQLSLAKTELQVNGRRGEAYFHFAIKDAGKLVGTGCKKLLLSGLQPFVEADMQQLIDSFLAAKSDYQPRAIA